MRTSDGYLRYVLISINQRQGTEHSANGFAFRLPSSSRIQQPLPLPLSSPLMRPTGRSPVIYTMLLPRALMRPSLSLRCSSIYLLRKRRREIQRVCTRRPEPGRFLISLVSLRLMRLLRTRKFTSGVIRALWRSPLLQLLRTYNPKVSSQPRLNRWLIDKIDK